MRHQRDHRPHHALALSAATALVAAGLVASGPATATPAPLPTCQAQPATIVGTPGDDVLRGTEKRDVIVALGGDDVIRGGAGDDVLCGGAGDDRILGQDGGDLMLGDEGRDRVDAGKAHTGPQVNTLVGGPGRDQLVGSPGRKHDVVDYSTDPGPVRVDLTGRSNHRATTDVVRRVEVVIGSNGDDHIRVGAQAVMAMGGSDRVHGTGLVSDWTVDDLRLQNHHRRVVPLAPPGTDGDDVVRGPARGQSAFLHTGHDRFVGGPGTQYLTIDEGLGDDVDMGGGAGDHLVLIIDAPEIVVQLPHSKVYSSGIGSTSARGVRYVEVRTTAPALVVVRGTPAGDTVFVPEDAEVRAVMGDGDDEVRGGASGRVGLGDGDDGASATGALVQGGSGDDSIHGATRAFGGRGRDLIQGPESYETSYGQPVEYHGGRGADRISGGPGDDTLLGDRDRDRVNGYAGTDTCEAERMTGCEA